jgi:hypothetical protein
MNKSETQGEVTAKLTARSLVLLSEFTKQKDLVRVRCVLCGSEFQAALNKLKHGKTRCECQRFIEQKERNLDRVLNYIQTKNGLLLDPRPILHKDYIHIQCIEGHEWKVNVSGLLSQKSWCSRCSGNYPRTLSELQIIVRERGGILKTHEYRGVDGTYDFECNLGHEFSNTFKKVEKGQWCPVCSRGSKSEEIARTTFEQLFNLKFPKKRPRWLRNARGFQMELDGFNEELGIAFEYQGFQHFEVDHWGTDLDRRMADDLLKKKICLDQRIILIELTHQTKYEDFPVEIKKQLKSAGYDISKIDFAKKIDFSKAYIRGDRLEELRALLIEKNIELRSNAWLGVNHKYEMRCGSCGSIWMAKGNAFFNRRRVAGCDYCNRRTPANKHDISVLVEFAVAYGGEILSEGYVKRDHIYKWRCGQGHIFEQNFNYMKDQNKFCPECEGRQKKKFFTQEEAEELFLSFGFRLIDKFTLRSKYLNTQCLECDTPSSQMLDNLTSGKINCRGCVIQSQESEALSLLTAANARPVSPFAGRSVPWMAECLKCNSIIKPRVSDLARGQGACKYCAKRGPAEKTRVRNIQLRRMEP